ncbi:SigE family RNA polymerase sigma factor [Streptomyces sp. NPDC056529]|uniref:SigE family RNA polymerase sigma factor n=1 Tax=Streptomyces sp. NPDC056529 TaxID=3345855 RepID=UPI0036C38F8A
MRKARANEFLEFASARTGPLFRSACLLTGGDVHLAEDLTQETLGRMYALWGRTAWIGNPAAYAQTVLVRTFLSHRRRRSATERPLGELPDRVSDADGDPALRIALLDALAGLAPKDRAVVVLRYWEDRSVEETAEAMNVSSAAVRTRSVRALAKLRERLGGNLAELAVR